ncbi:hypothetical protein [Pedobacter sp. L105]|uniref:hypothetical protein n=1 Tax=Pedobacter sp. L105 TaxID=1641871 RepID=UPI00131B47A5|nr:hypothetical protein [Pedobacter sp. L105]
MRKQKDTLWKAALELLFEDFLLFINQNLAQSTDLAKGYEFINKELIQEFPPDNGRYENKIVDKLIKLFTKDGKQILLHLEVQEKYSEDFGQRMYAYFNRLYDKYKMSITAYAIFTEPNEIKRKRIFKIDYMGTRLTYQYNIFKIAVQDDHELINHPSPFALIVLIAKAALIKKGSKNNLEADEQLLAYKLKMVKLVLGRKLPAHKQRAIMNFLFYYIDFEFSETRVKFDSEVNLLTNKNIREMITFEEVLIEDAQMEGYFKGRKEATREVKREAKENEVYRRIVKEGLSDQQIVDFAEVSLNFVKKMRANISAKKSAN